MKFEIKEKWVQKQKFFELKVDGESVLITPKLGEIVERIENTLKVRYLPSEQKKGLLSGLSKAFG